MPGGFDAGRVSVTLGFDLDDRQLRVYDKQVEDARRKPGVETKVKVDYDDRAYRAFMRDYAAAKALPAAKFEIKVDVDQRGLQNAERSIRTAGSTARSAQSDLNRLTGAFGSLGDGAANTRLSLGFFSTSLGDVLALAGALAPVLLSAAGAVTALAASFASAVAGVGALGVGLGATFAPAALLAIGVVTRLAAITKVYQAQQQATLADQTKAGKATTEQAKATDGLASAMDGLKNAQMAVGDARRSVTTAERDYDLAVVKARADIAAARDTEVKAARDVVDAQRAVAQARVDAQRALEDSQRATEDASISEADAIRQRNELQASGQTTGRAFFDAQRAVTDATTQAARAQQDNVGFAQEGVKAYQPLQDALQRLSDVTQTFHQRQKELVAIEAQGVHDAPGVIAAVDRIRTSREELTRAVRAQQTAERSLAQAQTTSTSPAGFDTGQAKAGAMLAKLDPVEQGLLAAGKGIIDSFRKATQTGVDAIFTGLENGLKRVPAALQALTPDLSKLGQTLGGITQGFLEHLTGPEWMNAWHQFAAAANPVAKDLAGIFTDAFDVLRDIALAVLPDLKSVLGDAAGSADQFASNVHKALLDGKLGTTVHGLVTSFRDWVSLIGQVGLLLVSVFRGGKKTGDDMVVSLTNTVKKWKEWIDANPAKVRAFFQEARTFLDNALRAIGPFVKGWLLFADAALKLAAKMPVSWLEAFGAAWLALAAASKFAGAIKVLTLMKDLVGKRLPGIPGVGGPGGPVGAPGGTVPAGTGAHGEGPELGPGETRTPGGVILPSEAARNAGRLPVTSPGRVAAGRVSDAVGGSGGIATIAALLAPYFIPSNSKVGKVLFGPGQSGPANNQIARQNIGYALQGVGVNAGSSLKDINAAIDELIRGGNESKLNKLHQQLDQAFNANKNSDAFNPNLIKAYADSVGRAADQVAAKLKAQQDAQRKVAEVADQVASDTSDRWAKLSKDVGASSDDMVKAVGANSREIKTRLGADTEAGAKALNENFQQAVTWVQVNMAKAGKLTKDGMAEITRLLKQHLADFGITGKQADDYLKGLDPTSGKPMNDAPGDPSRGHASGGWIGSPGERGGDYVHALLGRGEAVLNHYQQDAVNAALAYSGIAPGGLAQLFEATGHTRHYMARGGFAGKPKLASGGSILGFGALESLWVRAGGNPGMQELMAHVAEAESGGNPLARNPSGATGLWQILGQIVPGNLYNPLVNARNAVAKLATQGLGAWDASRSVWGRFAEGAHGQRVSGNATQPTAVTPLRVPALNATTGLGALVQGALRVGVRAGNAAISRIPGSTGMVFDATTGPPAFQKMVAFANQLGAMHIPYGAQGHSGWGIDRAGEDCSSTVSKVLHAGGALNQLADTTLLPKLLASGPGERVTVHDRALPGNAGHTIIQLGGRFFGTSASNPGGGPGWLGPVSAGYLAALPTKLHPKGLARGGFAGGLVKRFASGGFASPAAAKRAPHLRPVKITDVGFAAAYSNILAGGPQPDADLVAGLDSPPAAYVALTKDLSNLQSDYGIADRKYGQIQTPLIDEDTGELNEQGIAERVAVLQQALAIREAIVAKLQEIVAKVHAIMAAYQEAIRRLNLALPFSDSATQAAIGAEVASLNDELGAWGDKLGDLGYDVQNAQLDVQDTLNTIAGVKGTKASPTDTTGAAVDQGPSIAEQALAQLASFQASRADLFRGFGSNIIAPTTLLKQGLGYAGDVSLAAGTRFYGAVPAGLPVESARPSVEQHVHLTLNDPGDAHTFTLAALHELRAAV